MYQGKHSAQPVANTGRAKPVRSAAPRRRSGRARKPLGLVVALVLIFCMAVGGTYAWLTSSSLLIKNTMEPGRVPIVIEEEKGGGEKTSILVKNTGNIVAFIRVAVVSNEVDENGYPTPGSGQDIPFDYDMWTSYDGYYYYNGPVAPGASVQFLDENARLNYNGREVVVMAQSIQVQGDFDGQTASQKYWGRICTQNVDGTWSWA